MPADVKARYYHWYMAANPDDRLVYFEWWPEGKFESSMTPGDMTITTRENRGDTWGPPKPVAKSVPWVVAQRLAKDQGFHVEEAIYA